MKAKILRSLFMLALVSAIVLAACAPYDADYATDVCADSGVNSFNPKTGEVVCMSELAPADGDEGGEGDPGNGDAEPVVTEQPGDLEWVPYEPEGGIPYNGTTWSVDVAPDEIEVLTAGPACIAGVSLPGGTTRGSIIVLLPAEDVVVHYEVTCLIAGSNWHGSYRPVGDPAEEATWRSLAEDRIAAMMEAPNCTPGTGCTVLDVLVVSPGDVVVDQWVVGE